MAKIQKGVKPDIFKCTVLGQGAKVLIGVAQGLQRPHPGR